MCITGSDKEKSRRPALVVYYGVCPAKEMNNTILNLN
jgi:hypothetical protein